MQRHTRNHCSAGTPLDRAARGAALVEAAVILPVCLLGLLTMLDLGLVVAQSNSLSDCARHASRLAVVRGNRATEPLGPTNWTGTLDEPHVVANALRQRLLAMPPDQVSLSLSWPDGTNARGQRVEVRLHYLRSSLLGRWLGPLELTSTSTMRILH